MKWHTLVLAGELDRISAPVLETEIERLCEQGVIAIVLDLRSLSQIDSAGVAVIVHRCGWCARRGCRMTLLADAGPTRHAFARAGVSGRVTFARAPSRETERAFGSWPVQPEPSRAPAGQPQPVRPTAFAPPGRVALAATGHDGEGEARSASRLRVSGRWARARSSRRGRR